MQPLFVKTLSGLMTKPKGPFTPSKLSAIAQTQNIAPKTTTKNSLLGPFLLSPSNKRDLLGRITNHVELNTSLGFPTSPFYFLQFNLNFRLLLFLQGCSLEKTSAGVETKRKAGVGGAGPDFCPEKFEPD